jgi:hypothetical protein
MKVYQIVMKGDERSEKYARISRESFEPLINADIIDEIIQYDAITPDSENFEEHVEKYSWSSSLMHADQSGSKPEDHSPTEKAGMCSHWDLLRIASESDERILVLEHDSYMLAEHFDVFCELIEYIELHDIMYANIGLFMGCYTVHPHAAGWMYGLLTDGVPQGFTRRFPINCGPYCTLQRLFRTYTTAYLKPNKFPRVVGDTPTVIHPYHACDTLYFGRRCEIPFNEFDSDPHNNKWKTPTTQVISKSLSVTQEHHGYKQKMQDEPWTRHDYFEVID